jgi:hypothetical protein
MAVNQTQVDDIINAASVQDPAVRLQTLEREVDLLKKSIKHILMDIRERMNEMDNPFVIVSSGSAESKKSIENPETDARVSALEAREAALDARESQLELETMQQPEPPVEKINPLPVTDPASLMQKYPVKEDPAEVLANHQCGIPACNRPSDDLLPLQKAYNLFNWTRLGVKKFGHSRLEILVDCYCIMGYIQKKSADEIRQISHLMPLSIGDEREIDANEFVSEIYSLNRILLPHDTSFDRDMIEVMMNQRQHEQPAATGSYPSGARPERIRESEVQETSSFGKIDPEWMNLRV